MLPYLFILLAVAVRFLPFAGPLQCPAARLAFHAGGGIVAVFRSPWLAAPDVGSSCAAGGD